MSGYEGFQFKRPFQPNKLLKKNNSREPKYRVNVKVKDSHVSAVRLLLEVSCTAGLHVKFQR